MVLAGCGRLGYGQDAAPPHDAAMDAGPDASIDAALDAAVGPDTSIDASVDASRDAAPEPDATLDASVPVDGGQDAFSAPDAAIPIVCPEGFVLVPGNPLYMDRDFCLSKYEMLDVGGAPRSVPDGAPYPYLNPADGDTACRSLGAGYRLVSNDDWQVIARDIEGVSENWRGYAVGIGGLNLGNVDTNVGGAVDDAHPCDTVGQISAHPSCTDHASADFWYSRTHLLSSGELVWDLGGNRTEWVTGSHPETPRVYICALSGADQLTFGPAGNYMAGCPVEVGDPSPTYDNARGMGMVEGSGGLRIQRGGAAGLPPGDAHEGLFYANTHPFWDTDHPNTFGLRCVYDPATGLASPLRLLPAHTTLATGQSQTLRVHGTSGAVSVRVVTNASGGSLAGLTWTAGSTSGVDDVIEIDDGSAVSQALIHVVPPP